MVAGPRPAKLSQTSYELHLPALKTLHLRGYYARDVDILDAISTMPSLEELHLDECEGGSMLFEGLCETAIAPSTQER